GFTFGEQVGEEAAFDHMELARWYVGQHIWLKYVSARVYPVGGGFLSPGLFCEAVDAPAVVHVHHAVGAGVVHGGEGDGADGTTLFVHAQHVGEIKVGEDVAVEDEEGLA